MNIIFEMNVKKEVEIYSFIRVGKANISKLSSAQTKKLKLQVFASVGAEKVKNGNTTQLEHNSGTTLVFYFLRFLHFKNARTSLTRFILSRLTHQANVVVLKLVCSDTTVPSGASPTFSVYLVKKKLVCNCSSIFL